MNQNKWKIYFTGFSIRALSEYTDSFDTLPMFSVIRTSRKL